MVQVMEICRSPLATWLWATEKAEAAVSRRLARLSKTCAIHPWKCLLIAVVLTLLCAAGFARFNLETDGEKLWMEQDTDILKNVDYVEDHYKAEARPNFIILTAKDGGNVLQKEIFEEAFQIAAEVASLEGNSGQNYARICSKTAADECSGIGSLRFFNSSLDVFRTMVKNDDDILVAVNRADFPDDESRVIPKDIFGGIAYDTNGKIQSASAMKLLWLVDGDVSDSDAEKWEESLQDAFLDKGDWLVRQRYATVTVYLQAFRSLDDELSRTVGADIPLFAMAFFLMISFCSMLLGKTCSWTQSRRLLGTLDFFLVLQGMLAGYGLVMLVGVPFTLLQQILPFILVGIGIDDAFVITTAFDHTDTSLPIPDRIEQAIQRVGMSVTLTSLTDIAAFLLGATSAFPAVQYFCAYAAVCCFFIWLFHITSFCALLAMDSSRASKNKLDPMVCFTAGSCCTPPKGATQGPAAGTKTPLARILGRMTRILVSHPLVMLLTIAAFLAVAAISGWQVLQGMGTEFKLIDITPDTSFVRDFILEEERHWGVAGDGLAIPATFVARGMDFSSVEVQRSFEEAGGQLIDLSWMNKELGLTTWHTEFSLWAWANRGKIPELPEAAFEEAPGGPSRAGCEAGLPAGFSTCATHFLTGTTFGTAVAQFLKLPDFGHYEDDVVFRSDGSILTTRMHARHVDTFDSDQRIDALDEIEGFMDRWNGRLPSSFVTSSQYGWWDSYRIIEQQMMTSILLCLLAVTLISAFVLAHPLSVMIVLVVLTLIFTDLMGNILLWGLDLNSISMINLVMAVGLVVDYSMHVAHSFGIQDPKLPRTERAVLAMEEIGPAVFLGVSATFVAILPLAFASSEIFRVFFQMFFGIVVVGGMHGLVLMPVCLALCGPSVADLSQNVKDTSPPAAASIEEGSMDKQAEEGSTVGTAAAVETNILPGSLSPRQAQPESEEVSQQPS